MLKTHQYERLNAKDDNRYGNEFEEENEEIELGGERKRYGRVNDDDDDDDDAEREHIEGIGAQPYYGNGNLARSRTAVLPGSRIMQMAVLTLLLIVLYLILSITLTFYQKYVIRQLKFPLTIVTYHLVVKFLLAASVRAIYRCYTGHPRVQLDWRTSIRRMAPTGIASGIDIGFSNWGLELMPVSLYTMTKSTTIVFILLFALILGLERKSWLLVFTVGFIAIGLFMFTYKATEFDAMGFIFILVASLSSGIRWSFAQFVMQKSKLGLQNPVDMIYHMQPWMVASLLPFMITFEGQKLYDILRDLSDVSNSVILSTFMKVSVGAVLAFFMEISEFLVLMQTSSLTLSIAGIFKDIFQVVLAVEINNEKLSLINVLGLIVCLVGICCHLIHKYSTLTKIEELNALDDDDVNYHETSIIGHNSHNVNGGGGGSAGTGIGGGGGGGMNHSNMSIMPQRRLSAQTVPLLDQIDSDNSSNDGNGEQSASDVIFDVLKRRDMQR